MCAEYNDSMDNKRTVEIDCDYKSETSASLRVAIPGVGYAWIPFSQCNYEPGTASVDESLTLDVTEWFALKEELI
jgi:hypothetical protein